MLYYEISVSMLHRLGGRPRTIHRNFYNAEDPEELAKIIKNFLSANVSDDYEVLNVIVLQVDNNE